MARISELLPESKTSNITTINTNKMNSVEIEKE